MKELKPVLHKKKFEDLILNKLNAFLWDNVYKTMFDILKQKVAFNSNNPIAEGIKSGRIKYYDGYFVSERKFTAKQIQAFNELGAQYSKSKKGYQLKKDKMPLEIQQAIADIKIFEKRKYELINEYLKELQENINYVIDDMIFDNEVMQISNDLDGQFKQSMKSIAVIPPDLDKNTRLHIAEQFTNNLNFFIKKFETEKIPKMRQQLQDIVFDGYRNDKIEQLLVKEYGVDRRKAEFLAFNETNILVAKYRAYRFINEGVTRYKWVTRGDSKVRPLHQELNGKICFYNDPPIIDAKTGQRGNPGEVYNCRCFDRPVVEDILK